MISHIQSPQFSQSKTARAMRRLEGVVVSVGHGDYLQLTLFENARHFDRLIVVTSTHDELSQQVAKQAGVELVVSDDYRADGEPFNKGRMMNRGLEALDLDDWVLFWDADVILPARLRERVAQMVLDPECLYYTTRYNLPSASRAAARSFIEDRSLIDSLVLADPILDRAPWGYFQLFHARSPALLGRGRQLCCERFISAASVDNHFQLLWPDEKKVLLPSPNRELDVLHLPHGAFASRWCSARDRSQCRWWLIGFTTPLGFFPMHAISPSAAALCLTRLDTGDRAILPIAGRRQPDGSILGWVERGDADHVIHCGLYTGKHALKVNPSNGEQIVICEEHGRPFTGWGMGHVMSDRGRQGYVWGGEPIRAIGFDVSEISYLTEGDAPWIVTGE